MGRLLINPSFSVADRDRSGSDVDCEAFDAVSRLPATRRDRRYRTVGGERDSGSGQAGTSSNVVATESEVRCNWSSPTATDAVSDPVGHSAVSNVIASSHV